MANNKDIKKDKPKKEKKKGSLSTRYMASSSLYPKKG